MDCVKEQLLIKNCLHAYSDPDRDKAIGSISDSGLNWDFIVRQAQDQDIAPLLYYRLFPYKEKLPQDILYGLKDDFQKTKETNQQFYQEFKIILKCFKENNIEVIPLKGVDLAVRIYPDIGLRPMADLDLLIRKQDLIRIESALIGLDYLMHPGFRKVLNKPTSPYLNTVVSRKLSPPFISLHLHWHIFNNTLPPVYGYISNLDINRIWQETQMAKIDGIEISIMAAHHLLLFLSYHHLKHFFERLILLVDIDAVIKYYNERLDWQRLIQDAREFNLDKSLFYSLYLTSKMLDSGIPQDALIKLKPNCAGRFEKRFVNSVLTKKPSKNLSFFMFLAMNRGILKKLIFLFRTVFPHPKFRFQLQDVHGIKSGIRYTLNHLIRIFKYTLSFLFNRSVLNAKEHF